jgi:hypothetical protein
MLLAIACEPGYRDTAFRCDTDRGGERGCPDDQGCAYGRCRRGDAVGEVACGSAGTCTVEQQCCVDETGAAGCVAAGEACPGRSALCDGPADCAAGDTCCNGETTACGASCEQAACVTDDDCPSAQHCCDQPGVPWRACAETAC